MRKNKIVLKTRKSDHTGTGTILNILSTIWFIQSYQFSPNMPVSDYHAYYTPHIHN